MKRSFVRVIAILTIAVILCMTLASCGKTLSGKYEASIAIAKVELEFKGSKVIITPVALGVAGDSIEGKYEIDDDKITISFDDDDEKEADKYNLSGTLDFEEGEDYIKIGLVKFNAVK